mgnify:CR=1 FL=1
MIGAKSGTEVRRDATEATLLVLFERGGVAEGSGNLERDLVKLFTLFGEILKMGMKMVKKE